MNRTRINDVRQLKVSFGTLKLFINKQAVPDVYYELQREITHFYSFPPGGWIYKLINKFSFFPAIVILPNLFKNVKIFTKRSGHRNGIKRMRSRRLFECDFHEWFNINHFESDISGWQIRVASTHLVRSYILKRMGLGVQHLPLDFWENRSRKK